MGGYKIVSFQFSSFGLCINIVKMNNYILNILRLLSLKILFLKNGHFPLNTRALVLLKLCVLIIPITDSVDNQIFNDRSIK